VIEPANGPTSRGVCTRCGAERMFANSDDSTVWMGSAARMSDRTFSSYRRYGRREAEERTPINEIIW